MPSSSVSFLMALKSVMGERNSVTFSWEQLKNIRVKRIVYSCVYTQCIVKMYKNSHLSKNVLNRKAGTVGNEQLLLRVFQLTSQDFEILPDTIVGPNAYLGSQMRPDFFANFVFVHI